MPRRRKSRAKKPDPRCRHLKPFQFKPGQSGNPKGRPKGSRNRVHHRLALEKLTEIAQSKRSPPAVQLRASKIFLEIIMRAAGLWDV